MTRRAGRTPGTTYSASSILPPHAVAMRLPCGQVPIGVGPHRETICYDPYVLHDANILSSYNLAFIGETGFGKSSCMKTFLERMLLLPERTEGGARLRRAVIVDRKKAEYRLLAEKFGCQSVVLGHGQCLNPFDQSLTEQQQLGVLERFLRLLLKRDLDSFEQKCAAAAYKQARREWQLTEHLPSPSPSDPPPAMVLGDVCRALMNLDEKFLATTKRTRAELDHTAEDLAAALEKLTEGSQQGIFDGPTTTALDWSGQVIDIVVHPDYLLGERELIYQLLVICLAVWLDRAWQSVDPNERVDFFVCDEVWDLVKVRQFAEQLQDATKLGRSLGLCVLIAFHGPEDFDSAGDAGDAQIAIAKNLLNVVESFFLFHMNRKNAELLRSIAHLTDEDVEAIVELEPHHFLLLLGSGSSRRRLYVGHRITEDEARMVDTEPDRLKAVLV